MILGYKRLHVEMGIEYVDREGAKRMEKFGDDFPGANRDRPWTDKELLERLYTDELLSSTQISEGWDCSSATVLNWLRKHGIRVRTPSEAHQNSHGSLRKVNFRTSNRGYEYWAPGNHMVYVHRLVAVAEYGFDEVCGKQVHHINENTWDNRPSNLEVISNSKHQSLHKRKIDELTRMRIAELYEQGDISCRDLAPLFDVSYATILYIHKEFYGE